MLKVITAMLLFFVASTQVSPALASTPVSTSTEVACGSPDIVVVGFYEGILNRIPDEAGLNYWSEVLVKRGSDIVAEAMLNSPEARSLPQTPDAWYGRVLDRSASQIGIDYWGNKDELVAISGIVLSQENLGCNGVWFSGEIKELSTTELVQAEIREASAFYGLDVNRVMRIAECESGFNPQASNSGSSADGIFQFLDGTWRSTSNMQGAPHPNGDKFNYEHNVWMGAFLMSATGQGGGYGHWVCK